MYDQRSASRCAIDRLPTELLARIIKLAAAYVLRNSADPFLLQERAESTLKTTRLSLTRVNKQWNAIAIPYLLEEIRIGCKLSPETKHLGYAHTARLENLIRTSELCPSLLKRTRTMVMLLGCRTVADQCHAGVQICHLLSRVSLRHFSTDLSCEAPWLSFLVSGSAQSLTHLDIHISARAISCTTIPSLNALTNLTFLRVTEDNNRNSYAASLEHPYPESLSSLAQLCLPRLEELQLIITKSPEDVHPDGHIPLHIGLAANLPSLRRLHLSEEQWFEEGMLLRFLNAFGAKLEALHIQNAFMPDELERIHELAPHLTEIGCYVPFSYEIDVEFGERCIQHPRVQHLCFSGDAWFSETIRLIDRAKLPSLIDVRLVDVAWARARDPSVCKDRSFGWKLMEDMQAASELSVKGIPCFDMNGKVFGGLVSSA
ncbi:hypothetical protein PUNSTDRAFT_133625 [Punctularia strigosozonata HHB-11173 SS5]|uniref:uncharacterized protein n=1 Tax=Punctularia strigosozonata (strain HHB-11173) TaxID=741275 RepID=UPI0004417EAD|nr:uncharacterized protein PUNSTDRAFT_133625 [Punctularia strigosozonata HHB-11173 SS5]EIN09852.1 hypothetical protein PUNSTDRAFT_133625 [Punctularia strigosozonata HHB-11173 SS5]